MKRYNNNWIREKEFYSLKKELNMDRFRDTTSYSEVIRRIYSKYYEVFNVSWYPNGFKKCARKIQRAKFKQTLNKHKKGYDVYLYNKHRSYYWY